MPRRQCHNKALLHVCQKMKSLEVVVLPLSFYLYLILRNDSLPRSLSGVQEERDGELKIIIQHKREEEGSLPSARVSLCISDHLLLHCKKALFGKGGTVYNSISPKAQ